MQNYQYLLLAAAATWGVSAIGAASIFFFKELKQKTVAALFAVTAGVMLSISFFSLLLPAIEFVEQQEETTFAMGGIVAGLFLGALFIISIDKIFFKKSFNAITQPSKNRSMLIVIAIAAHNLPEALAVGAAFGLYFAEGTPELLSAAIALTIGISVHNFAEGAAVTFPLFADGYTRVKSFHLGHLSAAVYLPGIFVGSLLVTFLQPLLPFILAFAVGTMLYVIFEELLPDGSVEKKSEFTSIQVLLGFFVMTIVELVL